LAIDVGVLRGSGASGEPTGIVNTAGIGSVSGTNFLTAANTFDRVLEFQSDVATANIRPNSGGYVTTPGVAKSLMQIVKFSSTASQLWEVNLYDGTMAGYPCMSSNQMKASTMLYCDWDQVVIPLVGAVSGMEMLMPDGKLLVRPPAGADFDPWFAGLAERLANMDLSRVKRQPLV
jgi:hypothetical protein